MFGLLLYEVFVLFNSVDFVFLYDYILVQFPIGVDLLLVFGLLLRCCFLLIACGLLILVTVFDAKLFWLFYCLCSVVRFGFVICGLCCVVGLLIVLVLSLVGCDFALFGVCRCFLAWTCLLAVWFGYCILVA